MKTTINQVRRNGSRKAAQKQGSKHSQPLTLDTLRILLDVPGVDSDAEPIWFSPDGRLFLWNGNLSDPPRAIGFKEGRAWLELYASLKPEFEPPLLPEQTAGRQLVDFVTTQTTPATQEEAGETTVSIVGKTPEQTKADTSGLLDPALAALRAIDALARLGCKANEAGALALMLADAVKMEMENSDGWTDFAGAPGFQDGLCGLAHTATFRLRGSVDEWERNLQPMIERLRTEKTPVRPARINHEAADALLAAAGIDCSSDSKVWLEDSVRAMQETILLPAISLDNRRSEYYFAGMFTADELEKAFSEFWSAKFQLREAAIALEFSRHEGQRQAE